MKSGAVAVVGKPNVGKSTFVNRVVRSHVSIVSPRPATTRFRILAVLNRADGQAVLLDTPGFETPRNALGRCMKSGVLSALGEADAILMLIHAGGWKEKDDALLQLVRDCGKTAVLGINKADLASPRSCLLPVIAASAERFPFAEIIPFSALTGENINDVVDALFRCLPEGEPLFPRTGQSVNLSEAKRVSEIIREKILRKTFDEVPHGVAVEVEDMEPGVRDPGMISVRASIVVDRENLKPILIGKNGRLIREIGTAARRDIEQLLGRRVFLDLRVRVIEKWRDKPDVLRRFGYGGF